MKNEVSQAVLRLQESLISGRLSPWRAEQTEEGLNALLAKPNRSGEPFHLQRNALSDARKKLERRASLFADRIAEVDVMAEYGGQGASNANQPYEQLRAEIIDSVRRTSSRADQVILAIALEGGGAAEVAFALGIPYETAKVRLSRARLRAREVWGNA